MKRIIIILSTIALFMFASVELEAQNTNQSAGLDTNQPAMLDANQSAANPETTNQNQWWKKKFLNNTVVNWLIALGFVLGAVVAARALYWAISKYVKKITAKTETKLDDLIIDMIDEPLVYAAGAVGIWFGFSSLDFSAYAGADEWINGFFSVIITLIVAWLITRLFDCLVGEYVAPYLETTDTDLDDVLLPIIRRGVKIIIWLVALIVALDNAGYNITALLAGLGVGGLAFALAAKDSVENFFGGFTIFTDKPFGLKDRIKVAGFDGTVTEIGMRSTRLKTLQGRIVTIPNSSIANAPIENISSEPSRKVVTNLGLTYDMDQVKVAEAMKIVREIAADHKEALEEKLSVGFTAFGDFALNISFIYYIRKEASNLDTKTAINMDILERFNAAGLEFAFPSQTIYTKTLD